MTFYPDLGCRTQIASGEHVRAIGWLDVGMPYPRGSVDEALAARVREICEHSAGCEAALEWPVAAGPHECSLCREFVAAGIVAVPASDVLYVAPEMLWHYMERHRYRPPGEFLAAVAVCPTPGTAEYVAAVARHRGNVAEAG